MKTKLKIYLFRHGLTFYNEKHIFTGWKDSKLSPKGIKQSKIIAKKLKNKKFQVAYQTTLSRSKDTLKEVLKSHPECKKTITDDRMRERNYGNLQGMTHKKFIKREGTEDYNVLLHWHKIDHITGKSKKEFIKKVGEAELKVIRRSYNVKPPGKGESIKMVEKRVNSFINNLIKKMKKEKISVAISAHGNSMRPFRKHFEKLTNQQMMEIENPWDNYFEYTLEVK